MATGRYLGMCEKLQKLGHLLSRYHRYRVEGLNHIPKQGPALLVVHHSFATYDVLLLALHIYEQLGRVVHPLGDRMIFKVPYVAHVARSIGAVEGHPNAANHLLKAQKLVMVAPGGMREGLRPSSLKHHILWQGRLGFARLAIETGVPVIPAACPAADELYTVYPSRVTDFFYRRFKIPVPLVRGWGPTLIPRPLVLTHALGSPLSPPQRSCYLKEDCPDMHCSDTIGIQDEIGQPLDLSQGHTPDWIRSDPDKIGIEQKMGQALDVPYKDTPDPMRLDKMGIEQQVVEFQHQVAAAVEGLLRREQ